MPPEKHEFRKIMGQFATGVTVITTCDGDTLHGSTANAVSSLSLDPMMVLYCAEQTTDTLPILRRSGVFAINILAADQQELSQRFANKDDPEAHDVSRVPHRFGVTGSPILEGVLAYVDCRVVDALARGDHTIFIGQVEDGQLVSDSPPLLFFRGRYAELKDQ